MSGEIRVPKGALVLRHRGKTQMAKRKCRFGKVKRGKRKGQCLKGKRKK